MSVLGLVDRLRFRHAPPQVREAYRLYREMRYRGMLVGNAAYHALPHHQAVIRLLRRIRATDPDNDERLDELLRDIRGHHSEFARISEIEQLITPWEQLDELNEKRRRAESGADRR